LCKYPGAPIPKQLRWHINLANEIQFWDDYFRTKGFRWAESYENRFNANRPLGTLISELVEQIDSEEVTILDVGAGPLTALGTGHPTKKILLTPVDVLAGKYDRIFLKYGIIPPIRTRYGVAEKLTKTFAMSCFDLVYSRNAIDHCSDPYKAIKEMLAVAKPGGYVLLEHSINEAQKENWSGLHKWNFAEQDGEFCISGKKGSTNVTRLLRNQAEVKCEASDVETDWLVVLIRKKKPSQSLVSGRAGRRYCQ